MSRGIFATTMKLMIPLGVTLCAFAQQPARGPGRGPGGREGGRGPAATRPPLFFSEAWKQSEAGGEHPVDVTTAVSNPNLELKIYGDKNVLETGKEGDEANPIHLWTGLCATNCAAALRDKNNYVDLTGLARIRWITKTSGFQKVHPIIKLADGTWLVGDHADGSTTDWLETEFSIADVHWMRLDINKVETKGTIVKNPDLSKVAEIGFTDLMPGSGHGPGGWSDVARIEVFGKPVPRS